MRILRRANVLAATGRIARPLNRFEVDPLLYDLPKRFGNKRERTKRIRAYEAAWARLQRDEPGFAQTPDDQAFERMLLDWLRAMPLNGRLANGITFRICREFQREPDLSSSDINNQRLQRPRSHDEPKAFKR
jgi:hypothetical protein